MSTVSATSRRAVFLYTMTAGLGDLVVMGSLAQSVEAAIPGSRVLFVHRANPHTPLWDQGRGEGRFFNIFSASELGRLAALLRRMRRGGSTVFGLQMAPGSLQGFLLHSLLKKMAAVDYVVDFNLINADIITPPRGGYILDLHLNQIAELTGSAFPPEMYRLTLPASLQPPKRKGSDGRLIGIHPWSRRGHLKSFVWQREKWLELVDSLLVRYPDARVVLFGKDDGFPKFREWLIEQSGERAARLLFQPSADVGELVATISGLDLLVSVNTAVVHVGHALATPMVILCGPSLELWVPKGERIRSLRDPEGLFQATDGWVEDRSFGTIQRISLPQVLAACRELLA